MQKRRALTSLALVVSLLLGLVAAGGPAHAQRRNFCGTVRTRARGCIVVRGGVGAFTDFDITGAMPRPRVGTTIAGWGQDRGVSRCTAGATRLSHVTWQRATACPEAR